MPTVTEKVVRAYAHCGQARCPGNQQEQVDAVKVVTARSFREMGGTSPGDEVSWETFRFAEEEHRPCPHCGRPRDLSNQPRVQYAPLSGQDPMGLLGVPEFNPARQQELRSQPPTDEERERHEAEKQELREALAKQQAQIDAILAAQKEG